MEKETRREVWIIGRIKPLDTFLREQPQKDPSLHKSSNESNGKVSLFNWTGHPFVDAGLAALLLLRKKRLPEELTEEDVKDAIDFVSKLYARKEWSLGYIHAMIMPNNGIVLANPGTTAPISNTLKKAIKKEKEIPSTAKTLEEVKTKLAEKFDEQLGEDIVWFIRSTHFEADTLEELTKKVISSVLSQEFVVQALERRIQRNLWELFEEAQQDSNSTSFSEPICVICGKHRAYSKKERYRSVFPLLGTGDVPNYFPAGNPMGEYICSHCLFLVQFLPLVAYKVGGRVLVMHTYPYELMLELHDEAINDVRKSFLASNARDFKRPENFLFRLLGELTRKTGRDDLWGKASITLYHFVNNNQGQDLQIIHVPTPVLRFITHASREDPKGWKRIVAMGWRKKPSEEEFEKYERSYANEVYAKLLAEESILPYFIDIKNRRANAKWSLLSFYCSEVLGLDKKALEFIKDVGDRIVETLEKLPDNQLSRRVRELERAEKLYQFEAFFVNLEKLRQRLGIEKPLMTFDEFATVLTSYGEDLNVSWRTVKHLLLFRVYERLHDRLMKASEEEEEVEENEEVGIFGMGVEE
ncbi:type I-B CRISPR-associated protein Cas8b1/Cst1 [Thermococcus camini]|uniref:CRISPR-associated protein CXXC-CXXC domain-containing protein n=1 Tax=Thermococcus camini TaxID=2016373 RepID=A0A7G2D893_9EURY|nr:type I-B CRISPR-associated protein Cas8b1/Cst1 [Thermococcus camini]CAD5243839.1 conserved protein of unknown function [Thermococcus camini]